MTTLSTSSRESFGRELEGSAAQEALTWSRTEFVETLNKHSYILIRDLGLEDESFVSWAEGLGTPVSYAFGKVLNMEARKNSDESQFTHARVPLHQDAILNRNHRADYLLFMCKETPADAGGETLITDNRQFMKVAPSELLDELRSVRVAYRALTSSYYDGSAGAAAPIEHPALVRHPKTGEELLYIALDAPEDPRRNYEASVVGYSPRESQRLMTDVDCVLRRRDVAYAHSWRVGDIVVLDNQLVCHGRNAFLPGQRRRLLRVATE